MSNIIYADTQLGTVGNSKDLIFTDPSELSPAQLHVLREGSPTEIVAMLQEHVQTMYEITEAQRAEAEYYDSRAYDPPEVMEPPC